MSPLDLIIAIRVVPIPVTQMALMLPNMPDRILGSSRLYDPIPRNIFIRNGNLLLPSSVLYTFMQLNRFF